jgi:hypothetical protein
MIAEAALWFCQWGRISKPQGIMRLKKFTQFFLLEAYEPVVWEGLIYPFPRFTQKLLAVRTTLRPRRRCHSAKISAFITI